MQTAELEIDLGMFELLYWLKRPLEIHGQLVPISFQCWAFLVDNIVNM